MQETQLNRLRDWSIEKRETGIKLLMLFAYNIKEKRNGYSSENQFEDSQLNPIVSKINHLSALQPIIQKILDNTKFNTITTTLLKSSAPVKKVTAEIPNNTWEIEIQRSDIYEASLIDSLRTIFLQYQNKELIRRVLEVIVVLTFARFDARRAL